MKLLSKLSIIAGAAALATPMLTAQTTEVATIPVGVVEMTIPAGNTVVAPIFVNANDFQGNSTSLVEGSGVTTVNFGSSVFTAGSFNEGDFPAYYLEVVAGDAEGYAFDIISNTGSSVVVAGLLKTDIMLDDVETFAIRKHITLGQFFGQADAIARRDEVKFFNSDGSITIASYTGSSWVSSAGTVDEKPIYAGTGFISTLSNDIAVTATGTVKSTKTVVPIYLLAQLNLVATGSPVEMSVAYSGLGDQLARRDEIKFLAPGTLDTVAIISANGSGGFSGSDVTELPAGEAYIFTVSNDTHVTLPSILDN
ncbi:hypothetical protein [Cerasicoccus fimbriatus]|uniref:hypothetical protein n=1 Tax=Cerasicoccus fimbriatus TaxID=3014554 RepID=UPI0022B35250|nr:hypothetical protein [Cerasicoccus sp. TK19100]